MHKKLNTSTDKENKIIVNFLKLKALKLKNMMIETPPDSTLGLIGNGILEILRKWINVLEE